MTSKILDAVIRDHIGHLSYPTLRIAIGGRVLPESAITSIHPDQRQGSVRRLAANKIREQINIGGTLILSSVEQYVPEVRRLVQRLSAEFSEPVQANAYYSPGGPPGFQAHYDGHDVLVLQLEGEKEWEMFGVTYRCPLESQPYTSHRPPAGDSTKITLHKGDLLYVPRGYWHSVAATNGVESLHLSIGIHRDTRLDLLAWLLELLKQDELMRDDAASTFDSSRLTESIAVIKQAVNRLLDDAPVLTDSYERWRRERGVLQQSLVQRDPTS